MVLLWYIGFLITFSVTQINTSRIIDKQTDESLNLEIDFFQNGEAKFVELEESPSSEVETTKTPAHSEASPLDSWSVIWYIASFGGLIVFFLIVSCSEWCCRRAIRNSRPCSRTPATSGSSMPDTPPPSYDQFAPPSYESICLGRSQRRGEKTEYDIYVVPVHTLDTLVNSRQDAPPSYISAAVVT